MRFFGLLVIIFCSLLGSESFITKAEYASMLYKNPRGIGCHKCHGLKGEGKVLARYVSKKGPQTLLAPNIQGLSYEKFYNSLNSQKVVMPRYYLTDEEIEILYFYIKNNQKEK